MIKDKNLFFAFRSLSNKNFRNLWFGQVLSAVGMHSDMVARAWLVWTLTGSSTSVGSVLLVRALPMLILGLFGGVAADRFNKKILLMSIQSWSALMHLLMFLILFYGDIQMWHVYLISFGLGASMSMNQPTRTAIIPSLVDSKNIANALSLNSIAINSTRFLGPALVSILIYSTDIWAAYICAFIAYLLVLFFTSRINLPTSSVKKQQGNSLNQLFEGFKYMKDNRLVLALVFLGLGPLSIGFAHQTLLPQLVEQKFGEGVKLLGLIQSTGAIGGLLGGFYIATRRRLNKKGILMLVVSSTYAASLFGFGVSNMQWTVFIFIIIIASSQTIFRSLNSLTIIEISPEKLRGRMLSITLLDNALSPVFGLMVGIVADNWGVNVGYYLLSIGCFIIIFLVLLLYPKIKNIS
ncbi:MAG: MFS transporter [Dehalococcoidia bacterium]